MTAMVCECCVDIIKRQVEFMRTICLCSRDISYLSYRHFHHAVSFTIREMIHSNSTSLRDVDNKWTQLRILAKCINLIRA